MALRTIKIETIPNRLQAFMKLILRSKLFAKESY